MHCILLLLPYLLIAYVLHPFILSKFFYIQISLHLMVWSCLERTASKSNIVLRGSLMLTMPVMRLKKKKNTSGGCFSILNGFQLVKKPLDGGRFEFLKENICCLWHVLNTSSAHVRNRLLLPHFLSMFLFFFFSLLFILLCEVFFNTKKKGEMQFFFLFILTTYVLLTDISVIVLCEISLHVLEMI